MSRKIAIDAGHGHQNGHPTGAQAAGLIEDDLALAFATTIGHYVRARQGHTVMTRPNYDIVDLNNRGRLAVTEECNVFLSIHINAAADRNAHGAEAFIASGAHEAESRELAQELLAVLKHEGMPTRGVKLDNQGQHTRLAVLRSTHAKMPAVLLEIGFITSGPDREMLNDRHWRERVSAAIANVLVR